MAYRNTLPELIALKLQILDDCLKSQRMEETLRSDLNEAPLGSQPMDVYETDCTLDSSKEGIMTRPNRCDVNRRKIFKLKCRRYMSSTLSETQYQLPSPEVISSRVIKLSDKNSENQTVPQVKAVSISPPLTPIKDNKILKPRGKYMGTVSVTSTPSNGSRCHIFKRRCLQYLEEQQIPSEIKQPAIIKNKITARDFVFKQEDEKITEPKESAPVGKGGPIQDKTLKTKIENIINDTCEKISAGATPQTLACLNDEFNKLINKLRNKGYKERDSEEKFSPNAPAKDPVDLAKRKEFTKKSHVAVKPLKQCNRQLPKGTNVEKVPIGMGYAQVPGRLLKNLNWKSFSNCTRKLMAAVFPRRILATHSLTGKASPAFPGKPAKKMLDPKLINDIIITVMDKCHVSENRVRVCITTKCADESKMLRSRQQKIRLSRSENHTDPSSMDDDDDSASAD